MPRTHKTLFITIGIIIILISLFLWREIINYRSIATKAAAEPLVAETATILNVGPNCNCRVFGNGAIWVTEFLDLNDAKSRIIHKTLSDFVKANPTKIQLFVKHSPVAGFFSDHALANKAAFCAGEQNKLGEYLEELALQNNVKEKDLRAAAAAARVKLDPWWRCVASAKADTAIKADLSEAMALQLGKPPLLFINNKKVNFKLDFDLNELLNRLLES